MGGKEGRVDHSGEKERMNGKRLRTKRTIIAKEEGKKVRPGAEMGHGRVRIGI